MITKRFLYKGLEERLPKVESAIKIQKITRKDMYLILKYFEINPDCFPALKEEFPDV